MANTLGAALLRGMEAPGVGDSERLVAAVLAAAREQLHLDLRYELDPPPGSAAILVEADDGRQFGSLIPERPASRFCQKTSFPIPTGEMTPRPVMTTRRRLISWRSPSRCSRSPRRRS